jgi:hypothetical protein
MISAARNIPQGDSSCGSKRAGREGAAGVGAAAGAVAAGVAGAVAAGAVAAGAVAAGGATGVAAVAAGAVAAGAVAAGVACGFASSARLGSVERVRPKRQIAARVIRRIGGWPKNFSKAVMSGGTLLSTHFNPLASIAIKLQRVSEIRPKLNSVSF